MSGKRRFVEVAKEAMGRSVSDNLSKGIGCSDVRISLAMFDKNVHLHISKQQDKQRNYYY